MSGAKRWHRVVLTSALILGMGGIGSARPDDAAEWQRLNRQGVASNSQGRYADAVAPLRQALALCSMDQDQRADCATVAANLCISLVKLGRTDEGVPVCQRSLDAFRSAKDIAPSRQSYQLFHGDLFLADLLKKSNRVSEAEALFKDAVQTALRPNSGISDGDTANALIFLGLMHRDQNRLGEAASEFHDAAERGRNSDPANAIKALDWLQDTLWRLKRDDESGAAAQVSIGIGIGPHIGKQKGPRCAGCPGSA
jgi:tetratricopeptide (TPR) repeat protein